MLAQNVNLNHLIEPSFQEINRFFVLAFEDDAQRTSNKRFYIPNVEIKDNNVMIDGRNFFDQPVKNDKVTYDNIRKIATGQGDDYTTGCLLHYIYFKKYYKMIAINLSKQQALDSDPKAIQQINFTANLDRVENTRIYFILEEAKENFFEFFTRNRKSFLNIISLNVKYSLIFHQYKVTQYNSLNVKLSNSQLNKLKSARKNENEAVLRLPSNMIGDNETNFPHKLLLTNRQVSNLRRSFANNSSTDVKLSKPQLSKMIQSGGFLSRLLGPLLKTGLPLIKSVIKPLVKSVLIPLGLTAAASATDPGIH